MFFFSKESQIVFELGYRHSQLRGLLLKRLSFGQSRLEARRKIDCPTPLALSSISEQLEEFVEMFQCERYLLADFHIRQIIIPDAFGLFSFVEENEFVFTPAPALEKRPPGRLTMQ